MKKLFCCTISYIVLTASTCGPLSIGTVVKSNIHTQTNTILLDSKVQVEFQIVHSHAASKHTGLIFRMLLINRHPAMIIVKPQSINVYSDDLKFTQTSTDIAYNSGKLVDITSSIPDTALTIMPNDTLLYQNIYSSSFRGKNDKFRDTLRYSRVFFDIHHIYIDDKEVKAEKLEIVPILND